MSRRRTGVIFGVFVFALCVAWSATVAAAPGANRTEAAKAAKATSGARHEQMAGKSAALIAASDTQGLAAHLRQLKSDAALDDAARERLLRETVLELATLTPQSDIETEIRSLSGYQTKAWIIEDEHGHPERFPAYDVAAAARFRRAALAGDRGAQDGRRERSSDPILAVVDRYISGSAAERQGFEEAFAAATPERVAIYADDLERRLAAGAPVAGLARVVALVSGDEALLEAVILDAPPQEALRALATIDPAGGSPGTLTILAAAAERDATASVALLKIAPLATTDASARRLLFDALDGPHGASAAAALARGNDPGIIDELAELLRNSDDELQRRRALLALRLTDNERSRDHLRAFARGPETPTSLLAEVPSWLRQ